MPPKKIQPMKVKSGYSRNSEQHDVMKAQKKDKINPNKIFEGTEKKKKKKKKKY